MKTGNTRPTGREAGPVDASMEPGHEDREYPGTPRRLPEQVGPQWSPVMKTGNTNGPPSGPTTPRRLNGARS